MGQSFKLSLMSLANHFHKVLYPSLKLKYFHEQSWEKEWIDTAKWLICEEFTDRYKTSAEPTDDTTVDVVSIRHLIPH